jgi:hypothetical protein
VLGHQNRYLLVPLPPPSRKLVQYRLWGSSGVQLTSKAILQRSHRRTCTQLASSAMGSPCGYGSARLTRSMRKHCAMTLAKLDPQASWGQEWPENVINLRFPHPGLKPAHPDAHCEQLPVRSSHAAHLMRLRRPGCEEARAVKGTRWGGMFTE